MTTQQSDKKKVPERPTPNVFTADGKPVPPEKLSDKKASK